MRRKTEPQIIKIPAKAQTEDTPINRRRVAAYVRVSTMSERQESSFEAQKDYYTRYIEGRSDWELVEVYCDDGVSGLSYHKREGFKRMIADALDGKIDLIITKSLSRFARNTVDTLTTLRKLKEADVEVYFQKENIFTMDPAGEFLITLLSSFAQEESRSISENVIWSYRKSFADGKYFIRNPNFLGYERAGKYGFRVNRSEAKIVRIIYERYLLRESYGAICRYLERRRILSPAGNTVWKQTVIDYILSNEKYMGDALLQKEFTVDYISKKQQRNKGELPQYYVVGGHKAIVSREVFELAQTERRRRKALKNIYSCTSDLSPLIFCGRCGASCGRKIIHSNEKYRSEIWRCSRYYDGGRHSPTVSDVYVRRGCKEAVLWLMGEYVDVLDDCRTLLQEFGLELTLPSELWEPDTILLRSIIDRIEVQENGSLRIEFINGYKYSY